MTNEPASTAALGSGPHRGEDAEGDRTEEWLDSFGRRHRVDGPAYIAYFADGMVKQKLYREHGQRHRIDGPSEFTVFRGTGWIEKWFRSDVGHRVDGPAVTTFRWDGSVERASFRFRGGMMWGPGNLAVELEALSEDDLHEEYRHSGYRVLLEEGHSATDVLGVFGAGIGSVEGIRAVLEGAPVEWVKAFASGKAIGYATSA